MLNAEEFFKGLIKQSKKGEAVGICSVCSANRFVLEAALEEGNRTGNPVLIEATANQINQFGGYTGMKPADFVTAAMYLNGSWLPNEIRGVTGDEFPWGAFAFPDLGGVDGNDANNCSFQCFAINKESQHPDEAFKLIEWLTTGEADQHIALASWGIPADPANTDMAPAMKEFADVCSATNVRYQYAVGAENNGDATGALTENLMRLCGGQITAEEFIEAMAAAY